LEISLHRNDSTDAGKYKQSSALLSLPGIKQYTSVSGIDAGYGFFAPNVASSYILRFDVVNSPDSTLSTIFIPPLKTKEGLLRYTKVMDLFQDRLQILERAAPDLQNSQKDSLYTRYLDVLIKSIGRKLWPVTPQSNAHMTATLFRYNYPSLQQSSIYKSNPFLTPLLNLDINRTNNRKDVIK
jgi:hypothetical protein